MTTTYVLVPGACHGSWCFDDLANGLRAHNYPVHALTLAGLGPNDSAAGINLSTHIDQVAEVVADIEDVVLVGHSYGGMVITGVADKLPDHVSSLVYLDAFVPEDGDSCWHLTNDDQRAWYVAVDETGFGTPPLPFFDERAKPHPLACFLQPIRLTGSLSRFRKRDYVYATRWGNLESPFTPTYNRLQNDPEWTVHTPDAAHNLMRDIPEELVKICLTHGSMMA